MLVFSCFHNATDKINKNKVMTLPTSKRAYFDYYMRWLVFTILIIIFYFHTKGIDEYEENITIPKDRFDDNLLKEDG